MNLADIHAFMLGYIEAALKEQLVPKYVDELFDEAEAAARKRLKNLSRPDTK